MDLHPLRSMECFSGEGTISEEDLPQEVFKEFDSVGDEKIYVSQVGDVLRVLGLNPTDLEINCLSSKLQVAGRISFQTFLLFYQSLNKKDNYKADEIAEAFRSFDRDSTGLLQSSKIRHLLKTYGEKLEDEEINEIFKDFEDDHGFINYTNLINEILHLG